MADSILSSITGSSSSSSSSSSTSGFTSTSTMLANTKRTSIFDFGYIPTTKVKTFSYDEDYRTKTYLQVSELTSTSGTASLGSSNNILSGLLSSSTDSSGLTTNPELGSSDLWEIILVEYSEAHAEKAAVHNTLSDSFCWFATGPQPIQINLTCMLLTCGEKDYRTEFLYAYTSKLRAKQLTTNERVLRLIMKDTLVALYVTSMDFTESSEMPTYSTVTIEAIGYKYRNIYSEESTLISGYYGTETAVSTATSSKSATTTSGVTGGSEVKVTEKEGVTETVTTTPSTESSGSPAEQPKTASLSTVLRRLGKNKRY